MANLKFDFLWIEMEHSPITLETAREMILATRGLNATPGIDAIYIGTSDLSYPLGHGSKHDHPAVRTAIDKIVEATQRNKVPVGRPARGPEAISRHMEMGSTLFQSPSELGVMRQAARQYLGPLAKKGFDPAEQPLY